MLSIDTANPTEQAVVSRLSNAFNPAINKLLLLDWLTANNLPFRMISDHRFQRILLYNNPLLQVADLPSHNTLWRVLNDEYQRAIGPVTEALQNARGLVHLTFDGWTSKRMHSFISVDAHFVDGEFRQHDFKLGLPPVRGTHKGTAVGDEVAEVINYFGISKMYVFPSFLSLFEHV